VSTVHEAIAPLVAGDTLSRAEFLRRWEAMPEIKYAELIGGIVYMPSPATNDHSVYHCSVDGWLNVYAAFTPGCQSGGSGTWLMLQDAPQPDGHLWILPEYGGQARRQGKFPKGAPELAAEVSLSSTAYDLHQKLELYQEAGVQEYLVILLREREIRWHRLRRRRYVLIRPARDGLLRSEVFPGLWLDGEAFLADKMSQVYETLQKGLRSAAHAEFVQNLAARKH
jgi:Uma2 family endonuclease